jgi:hypothetical protein
MIIEDSMTIEEDIPNLVIISSEIHFQIVEIKEAEVVVRSIAKGE